MRSSIELSITKRIDISLNLHTLLRKELLFMNKTLSKEQVDDQRFAFAIKACHMMGYDAEKAADLLEADVMQIRAIYTMIDNDLIDFDSK